MLVAIIYTCRTRVLALFTFPQVHEAGLGDGNCGLFGVLTSTPRPVSLDGRMLCV